jgi:lipid-A-disaccharide synthase
MPQPPILISAGDPSGEMYAAQLATALRERTAAHLFGLGGPRMREAGVELLADSAEVAVVGISEVVRRLPSVWRVYRRLADEAIRRRPALAILVDFPDFNLRLAHRLHAAGIRCVYFISPQVWAWRPGRVHLIKRLVERVLCIFPFEEPFYRDAGVPVDFVGHPLVDMVKPTMGRAAFCARHRLDPAKPMVALLPGSRSSELRHHLPPIAETCLRILQNGPCQFAIAGAPGLPDSDFSGLTQHLPAMLITGVTHDVLAAADASIIASGTATIEAALLGAPMAVVYRVSATSALILRRMIRTPHFAMVNLIAGRRVVPEFIQDDFTPDAVAAVIRRLLDSPSSRDEMRRALADVRARLGPGGAIPRAAAIITNLL